MATPAAKTIQIIGVTIGCMALGYGLLKTTVPTEEESYNAMAPDLRKKVDAARKARLEHEAVVRAQIMAQRGGAAAVDPDTLKPVWSSK